MLSLLTLTSFISLLKATSISLFIFSLTFSFTSSTSSLGPSIKSSTLTPKVSAKLFKIEISGVVNPLSHFETELAPIPNFSANSSCVKFNSFLFFAIN